MEIQPAHDGFRFRPVLAAVAAAVGSIALAAGTVPAPLHLALQGGSVLALAAFAGLWFAAHRVLGVAPARIWRWAAPLGIGVGFAETIGLSFLQPEADLGLFSRSSSAVLAWMVVHGLGVAVVCSFAIAALLVRIDRPAITGAVAPEVARHRWSRPLGGWRTWSAVAALLVVVRLPVLIAWWPGIVPFDTFRSLASVLGTREWTQFEPVGHTVLIGFLVAVSDGLGLGDTGTVALGSAVQMITSSAASALMLARIAAWGINGRLWHALLVVTALHPVLGMFSVAIVKDTPFSSALVVFATSLGEIVFGRRRPDGRAARWPWIVLTASAVLLVVLRNNGVYVTILGLLIVTVLLRGQRRRMLAVLAIAALAFGAYAGPLTSALGAAPGPAAESLSVPLQQIARIAAEHRGALTPDERSEIDTIFLEHDADSIGAIYDPQLSDPVKADAAAAMEAGLGTGTLLNGWLGLVLAYPGTALEATLANTVGYWSPSAPSRDGLVLGSSNGVRGVTLDLPEGEHGVGVRGFIVEHDLLGRNGLQIPVAGLLLSPGAVVWAWVLALAIVLRARDARAAAVFIPFAVLLLTVLAGPVSGGMRYTLGLVAALPLAIAAAALAVRRAQRFGGVSPLSDPEPGGNTNRS